MTQTYLGINLPDQTASGAQETPDQGRELGRGLGLGVHGSVRVRAPRGPSAGSSGIRRSARDANGSGARGRRERGSGGRGRVGRGGCVGSVALAVVGIGVVLEETLGGAHGGDLAVGAEDGAGGAVEHQPGPDAGLLGDAPQRFLDGFRVGCRGLLLVRRTISFLCVLLLFFFSY